MRETSRSPEKESILDREAFEARLREERARSDRLGYPFVVLAYAAPDNGVDLAPVGAAIAHRVRESDVVGWLEPTVLGVLMLYLEVEEAPRLAEELVAGISWPAAPLKCTVHPHPPLPWRTEEDSGEASRDTLDRAAGEP